MPSPGAPGGVACGGARVARLLAREVCSLSLRSPYRGKVVFTVFCVQRPRLDRVYLVGSRTVLGARGLCFNLRRRATRSEIISAAAFAACCLVCGEQQEDERFLAQVGADRPAPPDVDAPGRAEAAGG